MAKGKANRMPTAPAQKVDKKWRVTEGNLAFGNLVIENDEKAHIVVLRNRIELDRWLSANNLRAEDIDWG